MDVLLLPRDSDAPSRHLRFVEAGVCHQVLADRQLQVVTTLLPHDAGPDDVQSAYRGAPARLVVFLLDEFLGPVSLHLLAALRSQYPDTPICAAGVYPTLAPDKVLAAGADYLVVGEGEIALFELATVLCRGGGDATTLKNVWVRQGRNILRNPLRPLQDNLDMLPYPDRSVFQQEGSSRPETGRTLYLAASRGCPFECLFCYSPLLRKSYEGKGSYYRVRSPQHVAGELLSEIRRGTYNRIVFVDEVFPTDKTWLRTLAGRLGSTLPMGFEVTAVAEKCDPDVLDLLKAAGCQRINIGLETGNDPFRKRMANRNLGNDRLRTLAGASRERGISLTLRTMVGLPLESDPLAQETMALVQEIQPDAIVSLAFQPIEGTPFHSYIRDNKLMAGSGETPPDFSRAAVQLPELNPESVRNHLFRMHFFGLSQTLKTLPHAAGYLDLLQQLPKAAFNLQHTGSLDIGTVRRESGLYPFMALRAGASCRFSVPVKPGSLVRFSLMLPEAAMRAVRKAETTLAAEIAFEVNGKTTPIFWRSFAPDSQIAEWTDCLAALPVLGGDGELVFRVTCSGGSGDVRAFVLWGTPVLAGISASGTGADGATAGQLRAEFERSSGVQAARIRELARTSEAKAREDRDERTRRLAELHVRVMELEKLVGELAAQAQKKDPGIAEKIRRLLGKADS